MSFFVIEGLDGSGKSTQVRLLQEYFRLHHIPYKYIHFPRTDSPVYGELIAMFLRGDLGPIRQVDPHLVALIYAGDRKDISHKIIDWISKDYLVMIDRYVYSNIAFQCAKIEDNKEKVKLKQWILYLEYEYHKIPKPELTLFLDVPFNFTRKQLTKTRKGKDRDYLKGAQDIHEQNLNFQQNVRESYLDQKNDDPGYFVIDCKKNEQEILKPEQIFKKIINRLIDKRILKK